MHPMFLGHPEGERQLWRAGGEPVWQCRIHPCALPRPRYGTGLGEEKIIASSWRGETPGLWGDSVPGGGVHHWPEGSSSGKLRGDSELGHILVIPEGFAGAAGGLAAAL